MVIIKRIILTVCLIAIAISFAGCSSLTVNGNLGLSTGSGEEQGMDIREIVWNKLSREAKDEILGTWSDGEVDRVVANKDTAYLKYEEYDGREVCLIAFKSNKEDSDKLGFLVDDKSKEIIGISFND